MAMPVKIDKKNSHKQRQSSHNCKRQKRKHTNTFFKQRRKQLAEALKDKVHVVAVIACDHYLNIQYSSGERLPVYGTFRKARWLLRNNYFYLPRPGSLVNLYHYESFDQDGDLIYILFPYDIRILLTKEEAKKAPYLMKYLSDIQFLIARKKALT